MEGSSQHGHIVQIGDKIIYILQEKSDAYKHIFKHILLLAKYPKLRLELSTSSSSTPGLQAHEELEHSRIVRRSKSSDGIPADLTLETLVERALLVVALSDVVEDIGVGVLSMMLVHVIQLHKGQ